MNVITPHQAEQTDYDVVIVGGGIAGALMAKTLTRGGKRCLILEAGDGENLHYAGYRQTLQRYRQHPGKSHQVSGPRNVNAPAPHDTALQPLMPDGYDDRGYLVQRGPLPFSSTYCRQLGGTSLQWLGSAMRMLPEDFELQSRYGIGLDWPLRYNDLEPWYRAAEYELGVSANVEEQAYLGIRFPPDYVYPMQGLPPAWGDRQLARRLNGMTVMEDGQATPLTLRGTPSARNGVPHPGYDHGRGYHPRGAAGSPHLGLRCSGNSYCTPLCPTQARYNALKTLEDADPALLDVVTCSVAHKLLIDPSTDAVTGVQFRHYVHQETALHHLHTVSARRYVLAGNAIANAVLLLASDACKGNDLVGRHLMDHPVLPVWGRADAPLWPMRGPLTTSGIEAMRGGAARAHRAAYRIELSNDGWRWPVDALYHDVEQLLAEPLCGPRLRSQMRERLSRQFSARCLVEQLPEYNNRVTIHPDYRDALGNYRPVIHYDLSLYTRTGVARAGTVMRQIFRHAGIRDHSHYSPADPGYFTCQGQPLAFVGAGHIAGTHCMGSSPHHSVVDRQQRSWIHKNLYLVGAGNMVSMGTAPPTLTLAALTLWAAHTILSELDRMCASTR
ncbi:GMC family oxidoreductase [Dickeya fangzhongdai]|uniref:GMC family oxidoreductase n=1 Tax=Dickeya fangzhongdai TaxID=1778540 RepID=A0A2K8QLY0_9GAMM|nr:GMC family oxidoreductase [Dickeya fangzhongdai]ATZ94527.1 GMC family oxidoreductase [Dickeya fangzhongdai]QOH47965.1 GMC family oxidoreductase [Dickeya fangzhongdai]QOH52270.1 GMC family oxidoreductase [Dickeya fangzhongdai]WOY00530.1 GMC family oxidoreductase [Dickeya fangzhongdai]WOY04320.1 GMC family oxidoreductase [Dickeya fangzhongdai]